MEGDIAGVAKSGWRSVEVETLSYMMLKWHTQQRMKTSHLMEIVPPKHYRQNRTLDIVIHITMVERERESKFKCLILQLLSYSKKKKNMLVRFGDIL